MKVLITKYSHKYFSTYGPAAKQLNIECAVREVARLKNYPLLRFCKGSEDSRSVSLRVFLRKERRAEICVIIPTSGGFRPPDPPSYRNIRLAQKRI